MLDTRIIGRDVQPDDDGTLPYDDPRRSMLGDDQRAWAHERVRDTTRPWCLLVTAVVLNHMELPVERGATLGDLAPSGYAVINGKVMCTDEWDGYPAERERLATAIADRGPGWSWRCRATCTRRGRSRVPARHATATPPVRPTRWRSSSSPPA